MNTWKTWKHTLGLLALITAFGCDDGSASKPAKDPAAGKSAAAPAKAPPTTPDAIGAEAKTPPVAETPTPAADGGAAAELAAADAGADAGAADAGADAGAADAGADAGTPEDMAAEDAGADAAAEGEDAAEDGEGEDGGETKTASGAEITDPIDLAEGAQLLRLILAHDVVDRLPVDPATEFPAGHKINLFVEATNAADAEQSIQITWENTQTGRRTPATSLTIPVRKLHRTRAYRTMKRPGDYRVIVLSQDERELASLSFTVAE